MKNIKEIQHEKVYIVEPAGSGGICHYSYCLCEAMAKEEKSVILVTTYSYELENLPRSFKVCQLLFEFSENSRMPLFLKKGVNLAKHLWNFSVLTFYLGSRDKCYIHYQWYLGKFFITHLKLVKFFGKCIIYTAHNILPHDEGLKRIRYFQKIYNIADKIIVHYKEGRSQLINYFSNCSKKLNCIQIGNFSFFCRQEQINRMFPEEGQVILFFGAIRKYKGLEILLKAFNQVTKNNRDVYLLVVGRILEKSLSFYQNILDPQARNKTMFVAKYVDVEDVSKYFQSSDFVVLPYISASQSGITHIAYAFGKPVIASKVGGLPEIIENGKSGYLVTPGDEKELVDAINRLLRDPSKIKSMGDYVRYLSETRFNWKNIAVKTFKIYSKN